MNATATTYLICALISCAMFAGGIVTGKMLGRYSVKDREAQPLSFWLTEAMMGAMALVCFYMTWISW